MVQNLNLKFKKAIFRSVIIVFLAAWVLVWDLGTFLLKKKNSLDSSCWRNYSAVLLKAVFKFETTALAKSNLTKLRSAILNNLSLTSRTCKKIRCKSANIHTKTVTFQVRQEVKPWKTITNNSHVSFIYLTDFVSIPCFIIKMNFLKWDSANERVTSRSHK